jgi:hypothetical protein
VSSATERTVPPNAYPDYVKLREDCSGCFVRCRYTLVKNNGTPTALIHSLLTPLGLIAWPADPAEVPKAGRYVWWDEQPSIVRSLLHKLWDCSNNSKTYMELGGINFAFVPPSSKQRE